ncbi:MAG: copper oxidase, partial [Kamptonema sp. SIO4C4]|nr:copper oxidase [Kamptonema sp. SIO4C4]
MSASRDLLNRRQLLRWGLIGLGATGLATYARSQWWKQAPAAQIPPLPDNEAPDLSFNPMTLLRDFDYGTVKQENGRPIREFEVTANSHTLQLNRAISFVTWSLNGRVPAPTLRATEGEI